MSKPHFDVWVCEGRVCSAEGADALRDVVTRVLHVLDDEGHDASRRCRVQRGGCFGCCNEAPNVVVRRFDDDAALPSLDVDRLSLTLRDNESVYSQVDDDVLIEVLRSHLVDDDVVPQRLRTTPPRPNVQARLEALRRRRENS